VALTSETLKGIPLFSTLSNEELDLLVPVFTEHSFTPGHVIAREGTPGFVFFVIESGTATVTVRGEERTAYGPGDHFGEIALLDPGPRSATVTASSDMKAYMLSAMEFRPLVHEHPALAWSMIQSVLYLAKRRMEHDDQASAAAELGILFCIVATISGSLWAKAMWGSYWNWDPRETSIFFLLLIYAAYLALRSAVDGEERRARLSAVYSATAFVAVPFLMFIVPRIYDTLHPSPILPSPREKGSMDPRIRIVFLAMLVGFTALFFWLLSLRTRFARVERRRLDAAAAGA